MLVRVAEPARFYGSAGSVGTGKKVKDDLFSPQVFQGDFFAVLVLQSKVWGFIIDIHEGFSVSFTVIPDGGQLRNADRSSGPDVRPN